MRRSPSTEKEIARWGGIGAPPYGECHVLLALEEEMTPEQAASCWWRLQCGKEATDAEVHLFLPWDVITSWSTVCVKDL